MRIVMTLVISVCSMLASAQTRSVYLEEMTWTEVRDALQAGKTTAIIYTGSTEQNGPHMALGKHNFIAHYVAGRIAEELGNALVYPTLPFAPTGDFANKSGHMRFPGSVNLKPETFRAVVRDVATSALSAGFKNVFLLGDHGDGQAELKAVSSELDKVWAGKGQRVFYVPDVYFRQEQQVRDYLLAKGIAADGHAGAADTSELIYIDTQNRWLRRDKLARSDSTREAVTGVSGDPTRASAEMGREFIGYKVVNALRQIREFMTNGSR